MEIVKKKITDYVGEGGRGVAKDYVKDYVGGEGGQNRKKKDYVISGRPLNENQYKA